MQVWVASRQETREFPDFRSVPVAGVGAMLLYRHHAAVRDLALYVFELDRSMPDVELLEQSLVHVTQDAFTCGKRYVADTDVAGECVDLGPDAPHMQIVD